MGKDPSRLTGKILVVDDEKAITDLFSQILGDMEYEVRAVDDGEEALKIIDAYKPDVVVSDVHMPRIDGDELYKRAIERQPSYANRFIFLTGSNIDAKLQHFLATSGCEVLSKPFDILELSEIIKKKIGKSRS
jgi:two-component system sensor histidine kinase/response regulator